MRIRRRRIRRGSRRSRRRKMEKGGKEKKKGEGVAVEGRRVRSVTYSLRALELLPRMVNEEDVAASSSRG